MTGVSSMADAASGTLAAPAIGAGDIIRQIHGLPSLPAVVMDLLDSIDQDDLDISVLAQKVTLDQILTAKTLRFANSSFYGTQSKVTTIQQAIMLQGMQTVRQLIIAAAMTGCFPKGAITFFDFKAFWRHSIATAVCASHLAQQLHINRDYAYTAGLLHDIGRLVLVTGFPGLYEKTLAYRAQHDCHVLDAEQAVMALDHAAVGQALAQHWNFSDILRQAIGSHHAPAAGADMLTAIVHVADAITHALDLSGTDDDLVPPIDGATWDRLGLDEQTCLSVCRQTIAQFDGIGRLLT